MKPALLRPLNRSKLSHQIENQIKALIITNKLTVGHRLPSEEQLARQLRVGRRSVREALQSLEKIGLIKIVHGKGAFVTGAKIDHYLKSLAESINLRLSEEKTALLQLVEVRKLLEAGIASLAATRVTPQDLRIMEEALSRQKEAIQMQDLEAFSISDLNFHYGVVKASQNDILATLYNALSNLLLESRRKTTQIPGEAEKSLKHHQDIFLAVESGNEKLAHHSMSIHIERTQQNIRKMFKFDL